MPTSRKRPQKMKTNAINIQQILVTESHSEDSNDAYIWNHDMAMEREWILGTRETPERRKTKKSGRCQTPTSYSHDLDMENFPIEKKWMERRPHEQIDWGI